jgi:hypothetical protein
VQKDKNNLAKKDKKRSLATTTADTSFFISL